MCVGTKASAKGVSVRRSPFLSVRRSRKRTQKIVCREPANALSAVLRPGTDRKSDRTARTDGAKSWPATKTNPQRRRLQRAPALRKNSAKRVGGLGAPPIARARGVDITIFDAKAKLVLN